MSDRTYNLSLCLSGAARGDVVDALTRNPLFATPPPKMEVDDEITKAPTNWKKRLGSSSVEATVMWPKDPDDDYAQKTITVDPDFDTVIANAPDAFNNRDEAFAIIESLPFSLCTIGEVGKKAVATDSPESFRGHFALGWGCAFRGKGHDVLVSRRWLEFGPWQLFRRKNDLSIVLFHALDADHKTAVKQATPGYERMASSESGGYLRGQEVELNGLYRAKEHMFQVIVNPGQELNQYDLNNACAARAARRTGKDRIERLAYLFTDKDDAKPNLHELWLREIEVWYVDAKGDHRIDDDYNPKPKPPAWAK